MSILTFLICFVISAFAAAALFDFWHWAIGSPEANEHGDAEAQRGRILSVFGVWLCAKYNAANRAHYDSIRRDVEMLVFSDAEIQWAISAIHGRDDRQKAIEFVREKEVNRRLNNTNFINWYKPLGICSVCTMFWFCSLLGFGLLFSLTLVQPVSLTAWLFSMLHFAPVSIAVREYLQR